MVEKKAALTYNVNTEVSKMSNASIKSSIMCVYFILKKFSDEEHILSANRITELLLEHYDISMDRRAVYRNIQALQSIGIDIGLYKHNGEGYYLISRDLEVFDIRLLCDAIASSDMLPAEESKAIIRKLVNTLSIYDGRMLEKTTYIKDNQRNKGKRIFYNIDTLLMAISQGVKVSVQPLTVDYENKLSVVNEIIIFSPYATVWVDGNYYVIAKDENDDDLTYYRLDRIDNITLLERGADFYYGGINIQEYAQCEIVNKGKHQVNVVIEIKKEYWTDLTDNFKNLKVIRQSEAVILVKITDVQFRIRDWVLKNIEASEVIEPVQFRDEIRNIIMRQYKKYFG